MQIYNNYPSPNFGMALKIRPEAMEALKKAPMKTLESLEEIGNDLKDTKFYHLEIGEDIEPKITSSFAKYAGFFQFYKPTEQQPRILCFKTAWAGPETPLGHKKGEFIHDAIEYANTEAALEAYNKSINTKTDLERAALLTKELDNREIQKQAEIQFLNALENFRNEKVTSLFDKFGVKETE